MLSKTEISKVFPNLHGCGLEIKRDVANIFNGAVSLPLDSSVIQKWDENYPDYMRDMVYNNFVAPLLASGITEEEKRKIISRLDLFCASIL